MVKDRKYIVVIVLIAMISFGYLINIWKANQLNKFGKYTTGKVIGFKSVYQSYKLTYRYSVEGKNYENHESVNFFKCDDGTSGCKGKEFIIRYSSKNPKKQ